MKPRNKLEKHIIQIKSELAELSEKEITYIKTKLFKEYVYAIKKEFTCFNCSHVWENGSNVKLLRENSFKTECPSCNKKLQLLSDASRSHYEERYITKFDTYENFQLVRIFFIKRILKKNEKPYWYIREVVQHWINVDTGKKTLLSVGCNLNWNGYLWNWNNLEVKQDLDKYYIDGAYKLPNKKIHKNLKRNGFDGNFHGLNPAWFFTLLMNKDSKAETFLKMNKILLFKQCFYYKKQIKKYWNQIRTTFRHNYEITNLTDWFDHLELLERYGKDINSPKYICPENFYEDHQALVLKRQIEHEADRKRRIAENKELQLDIEKREKKEYLNRISRFLDVKLEEGNLSIAVIPTVHKVLQEGKALKHCVYENNYHKHEDSLLFSAKVNGNRAETVEFSLIDMKVVQARGFKNKPTVHHKRIVKLVNSNKRLIKKAM